MTAPLALVPLCDMQQGGHVQVQPPTTQRPSTGWQTSTSMPVGQLGAGQAAAALSLPLAAAPAAATPTRAQAQDSHSQQDSQQAAAGEPCHISAGLSAGPADGPSTTCPSKPALAPGGVQCVRDASTAALLPPCRRAAAFSLSRPAFPPPGAHSWAAWQFQDRRCCSRWHGVRGPAPAAGAAPAVCQPQQHSVRDAGGGWGPCRAARRCHGTRPG